ESSRVGDEAQTWCALSYVWGGDQPVKTTKETLAAHYDGIPFDALPKTIQDAVRVCRGLAIPYLWIDALCIIQGDEQDLRRELGKMPEIYQHATVTISAAWSTKADDGFLYRRGYWYQFCPPIKLQRVLLYRSTLLEWSCRTVSDSYGLLEPSTLAGKADHHYQPDLQLDPDPEPFFALSSSHQSWSDIVMEYSSRHLSFASDKLRALSAIAQVYHRETGKEYLAGLWREDLPLALCWFAMPQTSYNSTTNASENDNLDSEPSPEKILQKRPTGNRGPSWSWASIDDAAFMYPAADEKKKIQILGPAPSVKILKAAVTPAYAGGEFDSVVSGCLDIEGAMREV
ncbi:HET-domain-containing protein, partial [Neurospora tetrasperma FGSC 2509]